MDFAYWLSLIGKGVHCAINGYSFSDMLVAQHLNLVFFFNFFFNATICMQFEWYFHVEALYSEVCYQPFVGFLHNDKAVFVSTSVGCEPWRKFLEIVLYLAFKV